MQILNHWNGAGRHQHTPDLGTQVLLAYAAAEESPGPGERDEVMPTALALAALRQLLAQAQITYWEYPRPWPATVNPEAALSRATEACDNYVLVLSPRSLTDTLCLQGLLFAVSLNKRIVPVLVETVPSAHLPEPLQILEIIDFRAAGQPLVSSPAGQLLQTLRHEADYHRTHTQLLVKALQWDRQLRDPALLLQDQDLAQFQHWLRIANGRSPHRPIQLQRLYVAESERDRSQPGSPAAEEPSWLQRWLG
jgi:hypothetical protein